MSAISQLDPRRDMVLIRERIEHLLAEGEDPSPSMADLATRNAIALADLVVGPKAITAEAWLRVALLHLEQLESALAPNGLYRRLMTLCPAIGHQILHAGARRHPAASWLIELSRKAEGSMAGLIHLEATVGHPAFTQNCWTHAKAGHLPGLIEIAAITGRPEPAAALAVHDQIDAAALAMVAALEMNPKSPVVPMVAAAWGPKIEPVLARTLPHLRSKTVAISLQSQSEGYAEFSSLIKTIISAMVNT